jgi:hypothetical protein
MYRCVFSDEVLPRLLRYFEGDRMAVKARIISWFTLRVATDKKNELQINYSVIQHDKVSPDRFMYHVRSAVMVISETAGPFV